MTTSKHSVDEPQKAEAPLVLIAEDDEKTLRLVGEVIQRAGYRGPRETWCWGG